MASKDLNLVLSIQKPSQLRKILRELDNLENKISTQRIKNEDQAQDLDISPALDELLKENELDIFKDEDFNNLKNFLVSLQDNALVLHFTFNQPASDSTLNKLVKWIRENIDPKTLITTGLNNSIGVGFILRTTNKYYDFSLGHVLRDKRELLVKKISEVNQNATN